MSDEFGRNHFEIVSYEDALPAVKQIYKETMKTLQLPFVLNWFKCQGKNATLLRGNWEKLKSTLLMGEVPLVLKQLIVFNVSKERGCVYCKRTHGIFANSMGKMLNENVNFKITENLNSAVIPYSYKKAIKVVTKAALDHAHVTNADFEELYEAGFNDLEVQELMAQADLANMLNTIADISGITIDNELMEVQA